MHKSRIITILIISKKSNVPFLSKYEKLFRFKGGRNTGRWTANNHAKKKEESNALSSSRGLQSFVLFSTRRLIGKGSDKRLRNTAAMSPMKQERAGRIKGERWGEEKKEVGRERLDVSVEERQRRRKEESARNRPLNENVIRGSRNKAEKLGEECRRRGCGGEGAVAVRAK